MWERKCEEIDRYIGGTKVAEAWKTIGSLRKEGKQNSNLNLISSKEWVDYYKTMLTENRKKFEMTKIDIKTAQNDKVIEITVEEIKKALEKSKTVKSSGLSLIHI